MVRGSGALLVLAATVMSGCLAGVDDPATDPELAPAVLDLQVSGCREGGSYVTWNAYEGDRNFPFEFVPMDISDDVGRPAANSVGHPQEGSVLPNGNVTGAYHPIVHCDSWIARGVQGADLLMAFVGVRIHQPSFDPDAVPRQYLAGALAVNQPAVADAFLAAGFPIETLSDTVFSIDGGVLRTFIHFSHHGDIYSVIPFKEADAKPDETIRLWVMDVRDGTTTVRALDLIDEGGTRLVASAPGYFEHFANSDQPPVPGAPLHSYTTWLLGYTGFSRTFEAGPTVVLDGEATHEH
ncbi:MAG: hypothetical protein ACYC2H_05110 [Thermoplasmatota archaeon]